MGAMYYNQTLARFDLGVSAGDHNLFMAILSIRMLGNRVSIPLLEQRSMRDVCRVWEHSFQHVVT